MAGIEARNIRDNFVGTPRTCSKNRTLVRSPHRDGSFNGDTPDHNPSFSIACDESGILSNEGSRMYLRCMTAKDV
jgi:hypothetical protein